MPDGEMKKLLNHVSTIWLSLNECLARLFDQWDILVFYIQEEITQNKSVKVSKDWKEYVILKRAETEETGLPHYLENWEKSQNLKIDQEIWEFHKID